MSETFDPYRKWLGIPPAEQPADHYRLLGVGRFEDDPDTIANAADRQMGHVRTFQTGSHSAVSQKLLNEIAAARVCLLDRAKKAEYDARLHAKLALQTAPPPAAPVVAAVRAPAAMPLAGPNAPATAAGTPFMLRPTTRKKKSPVMALVIASVLLLAIGAVAFVGGQRNEPPESQPLGGAFHPNPPVTGPRDDADGVATKEDTAQEQEPEPRPAVAEKMPAPKAKLEIVEAQWGAGDRWQDVTERWQSLVYGQRLVATAAGNLFQGVPDPASGAAKYVRVRYRAAGQDRTAEFAEGEVIYLDGHPPAGRGSSRGLEVLDARYGAGTTWVDVLPRLRRWVHGDRLAVRVDLVAPTDPLRGQRKALFLRYRTSDGEFVAHAWDYEELVLDARPMETAGKAIDLIASADPARHSAGGRWRNEESTLVGPDKQPGNLAIGTPLTHDYVLTAVVEGTPRPDNVGFTLPIGDRQVQLVIDGWSSAKSALQLVDGAMGHQNPTTRHGTFCEPGQATTIQCAVRESSIYVTCNGRVAVDWRGDAARLSALGEAQAAERPAIVVRNLGTPWRISRLDVAPLGAEPSLPVSTSGKPVDLLKRIDPKLDAVSGEWKLSDKGLLSPSGEFMRLGVPYLPPDDYELRVVAERKSGGDAFFLGLIVEGRPTYAVFDGWAGTLCGLHGLDGEGWDRNATTKKTKVFVDERPKDLVCTVHPSSVHIASEGQTLIDWHGDARRFSLSGDVPDELGLQLGDWNTQFLISKFEMRPLPPEKPAPPIDLAQPVDVLKRIDPKRDAVWGEWRKEANALLAPGEPWRRLHLPVLPPQEYSLTIEELGSRDVNFGVVVEGRQVQVVLGGGNGDLSGLQLVDGQSFDRNSTTHHGKVLRDDGPNTIVCTVQRNAVEVLCNGQPVIDWKGEPRSLSLPHDCIVPDDRRLFLVCWGASYRITRLELSAPGAETPRPDKPAPSEKPRSLADLAEQPSADKPAADKRLPIPGGKELAAAEKKVAEMFDPQWKAAKKPPDRLKVARTLYETGVETSDNPVLRYALLREASSRAAGLGDASTACDAVEQLGRDFQIDPLAEKLTAIADALEKAHLPAQLWTLALLALPLSDRALTAERDDEARKFASLVAVAGRRLRNHDLMKYAERRLTLLRGRQERHARLQKTLARLREQPDDAAAHLNAGIELCLLQGDWQRGLPLLAQSGEGRWVEIAKLEAAAGEDPSQRAALVDAWLAESQKQNGALRAEYELQAKYWLDRGLPADAPAPDAARKRVLDKLAATPGISLARVLPGLDMAIFDGADLQQFRARRVDERICFNFGFGSPHPSVSGDNFSIRWIGWLKPPLPGKYVLKTSSDDGIRVRINGNLVIDHWHRGAGDELVEVELTDQPQPLAVEFNDTGATAAVCVSWALKDLSDFHVVPGEVFFHDPAIVAAR